MSFRLRLITALTAFLLVAALPLAKRIWAEPPADRAAEVPKRSLHELGPLAVGEKFAPPKITPECRNSIDRGTEWLLSAMRPSGAVGEDIDKPPDLGCTSMVGLALLAQGSTTHGGPHCQELRRVLDAVLNMVDRFPNDTIPVRSTTLIQRKIGQNADLFLASLFLSQTLGEASDSDPEVRRALEKLVWMVCQTQGKDGTWGNESWAPVLGTVMGWECLRASSSTGMRVDASAKKAGEALFSKLKSTASGNGDWMQDFYKNASSIRVLYSLNYREEPVFQQCVQRILKVAKEDHRVFTQAGGEEYLSFFLVTECMLKERDPEWQAWYPLVRDKVMRVQNRDGSWSGHHCIVCRTFCTAAALLTLQAPNLFLPVSNL